MVCRSIELLLITSSSVNFVVCLLIRMNWWSTNIPCCSCQCRGSTFLVPAICRNKCGGLLFNFRLPQCWNCFRCCSKCSCWCIKCFWFVSIILNIDYYYAICTNITFFLTDVWFLCRHCCCFLLDGQKRKEKSPYHKL